MLRAGEISVDHFAGGGGASTGMEIGTNRPVDIAINHDEIAIELHKKNHPDTEHYHSDIWEVDPVEATRGRPIGALWASPDCRHFSIAKGNKPVERKIRGLAWVVVRWAALVPVRTFFIENVAEFSTWGPIIEYEKGKFKPDPERKGETFDAFIKVLTTGLEASNPAWPEIKEALGDEFPFEKLERGLGYDLDYRTLRACDYGTPTIRKRLFIVGRNDGEPIRWPKASHGSPGSNLLPYRTAADIIDWSIPCRSIFNRKKPLAEKTMLRIAKGLEKFILNSDSPFTINSDKVAPFITEHANGSSQRNMAINEPLRTICAQVKGGHFAVVEAYLREYLEGDACPTKPFASDISVDESVNIQASDTLYTSHMIKMRGTNLGHETDSPVHTITSGGNHIGEVRAFLVKYYGNSETGESINSPIGTVTTRDRFGLVVVKGVKYQIVDIGMRMLDPAELFRAQGFPADYHFTHDGAGNKLTKAAMVSKCGNSVCPPLAAAILRANFDYQSLPMVA